MISQPHRETLTKFESIVMQHLPYLGRVARRIARPPIDPDDLVQDTLMRAWKYWGTFSPDSNCQAWLVRILTNVLKIHFAKTAGLRDSLPIDDLYRISLAGPPPPQSFDADQILEILSQPNRRLVTMIVIEGYSYAETALALGVPIGTVMSRLSRSRRKLARELVRRNGGASFGQDETQLSTKSSVSIRRASTRSRKTSGREKCPAGSKL